MFNKRLLLFAVVIFAAMQLNAQEATSKRPNILIIMTDQQTAEAMSNAGNKELTTPAMDQLAANGVRFTKAYAAQPLCTPSRVSIFSGRMPTETGFVGNREEKDGQWPDSLLVMGKIFKNAGYKTGYVGKWHLPIPTDKVSQHGFEYMENIENRDFMDAANPAAATQFMKANKNEPFLLVASFLNPHDICEWARDDNMKMEPFPQAPAPELCPILPSNWRKSENEPAIIRKQQLSNPRTYPSINWEENKWRQYRWTYNRLVEKVDDYVGMILAGLKKYGLEDNTIIIFTSDHGDGYAAHQWNQKQVLYEESAKVPFIVSKMGQWKPRTNDNLICNGIDIMPTILSYAGIKGPSYLKGADVKKVIDNPQYQLRDTLVIETDFADNTTMLGIKGRAVITHQYKYIVYDKGEIREQLFDLQQDPGETNNLAMKSPFKKHIMDMRKHLKQWGVEHGDSFNAWN